MNWYALRYLSQRDACTKAALSRRGVECFLPVERIKLRQRHGKARGVETITRPLIPGYVFVRCASETALVDLVYDMGRHPNHRRLIIGIAECARRPSVISGADINRLRTLDNRLLTPDAPRVFLVGQLIVITEGHASGLRGKVISVRKGRVRLDTKAGIVTVDAQNAA